ILLDPILIYGWCGLPELGVRGAAYATVLGQILSFLLAWIFHCKVDKQISNKLQYWKPNSTIIREIYAIGLPAILAQALMSVMTYGMNLILGSVNTALVTAYGLYYKIQQFILFAAFGLRDAITPVLSFYHGMRSRARIRYGIRYGMLYTWVIMLAGTLLIEALAVPFSKLFGLSGETERLCIEAMRIISISFLFAGTNIALQGIFQALDSGLESLIISVCRQILFVLPVAWLFSLAAKVNFNQSWLIWLTFPIAELVSMGIGFGFLHRIQKTKIAKL
ncbi:MAG: MATE family efflux transporter, partial [Ruminococcus sp.]|nr:MATE family efflux transporter [Ruminococcus sp.]